MDNKWKNVVPSPVVVLPCCIRSLEEDDFEVILDYFSSIAWVMVAITVPKKLQAMVSLL